MAGGYAMPEEGADGLARRLERAERDAAAGRGSNALESAVVTGPDGLTVTNPETGARMQYANGLLRFWSDYDTKPDEFGEMLVDPGAGANILRFFPPHSAGTGIENSITVQGQRPGLGGNIWLYADNSITARVQNAAAALIGAMNLGADQVSISANRADIDASALGLYSLPTTSSGPNLHLGTIGGQWTVAYVTSSERYKQDIRDADIDAAAPLRWRPRWWRDRSDVAAVGDDADFHHGFIAEELAEESPACVRYDDEGRPDSLRQMHMLAEVVALCQAQQQQIDDLAAANATLTTRIEALEAQ